MWSFVVLMSMAAVVGGLMMSQEARTPATLVVVDDHMARNMALYRQAVLEHVRANPGTTGAIEDEALSFPAWYKRNPAWRNTVLADGTVVVYAERAPSPTLSNRIAEMSKGSVLAGEARRRGNGQYYLHTPRGGDTGIDLPPIGNGSVVWLGRPE